MKVPFLNVQAQYNENKIAMLAAAERVLSSGCYVLGKEVEKFEKNFTEVSGTEYAIGVNSGTSALHLALLALGIGPGDEVITVSHTFIATVSSIQYTGATPVLVDIHPDYYTIDVRKIEEKITPRTKAIIPVHLYGMAAEMDAIMSIANKYGIPVIEDAAQAHGTLYNGKKVGSIGTLGCYSFYPGKNLGACGEAGMVVTDDSSLAAKVRKLRDWGAEKKYYHDLVGYNYRMDAIQGAFLDVKLRSLSKWDSRRKEIAEMYNSQLDKNMVVIPKLNPQSTHAYHVYNVRISNRDLLQKKLTEKGIATGIHYPIPAHLQKCYHFLGYKVGDLPVTERVCGEILSLPICPYLNDNQINYTIESINEIVNKNEFNNLHAQESITV